MADKSVRLQDLLHQPAYARKGSTAASYARFYGLIVSGLTAAILLLTVWQNRGEPALVVAVSWAAALAYAVYSAVRWYLGSGESDVLYHPYVQFLRCQGGILAVSVFIFVLSAYGLLDNELWLLYVVVTLPLSEGLSTQVVVLTLVEVALLQFAASYGGSMYFQRAPAWPWAFAAASPVVLVRVLWIWLLTFVLHYLVRNVQARNEAYSQHHEWLALIEEKALPSEDPVEQQRVVLARAARLTGAASDLWLPRLRDDHLVNMDGRELDQRITDAVAAGEPCVLLRPDLSSRLASWRSDLWHRSFRRSDMGGLSVVPLPPTQGDAAAQIIFPICKLDGSGLVAVLSLAYASVPRSWYQLEQEKRRLEDFATHMRVVLITRAENEHRQLVDRLVAKLHNLPTIHALAHQVVEDVVAEMGFDFATLSVVDTTQQVIRTVDGKNAYWVDDSVHDLSSNDVQSVVVRSGEMHANRGKREACLDTYIWRKYNHHQVTRVWIPIRRDPAAQRSDPVLGTIEAGFFHRHSKTIPAALVDVLQEYGQHLYLDVLDVRRHEQRDMLINALVALNDFGGRAQHRAALYDLHDMGAFIGEQAEKLLMADIVALYSWDEHEHETTLLYMTPGVDSGKGNLPHDLLREEIRLKLSAGQKVYLSPQAQADPTLVNLTPSGQPDRAHRSFSQSQAVQSFAGLPLVDGAGTTLAYLCANYKKRHEFREEERQILMLFAEQATAALEQARNQRLARSVAVSYERSSLAAELHDQLSQNLCGLKQFGEAAAFYAEHDRWPMVKEILGRMRPAIANSMEGLQAALTERRGTPEPAQTDLCAALTSFVDGLPFEAGALIHSTFDVRCQVPGQVQFYLLRIGREALANALKYAPGARIEVTYSADPHSGVHLAVEDDGPGFDRDHIMTSGAHGLFTMEHFAAQIHGRLDIVASPGKGTKIRVHVDTTIREEHNGRHPTDEQHGDAGAPAAG